MTPASRRIGLAVSLSILAASLYLLVTASPLLLLTVSETLGLPLGNLVAWAGVISLVAVVRHGFHDLLHWETASNRTLNVFTRVLLVLAIAWGFVCRGLSGNWSFSFFGHAESFQGGELASKLFWAYTVTVVLLSLLAAVQATVLRVMHSRPK